MGEGKTERNQRFPVLRSAGAAVAGAAAGAGIATGAGYGLRYTADTGGKSSEGGHLAPGGLMAFRANGGFCGLA